MQRSRIRTIFLLIILATITLAMSGQGYLSFLTPAVHYGLDRYGALAADLTSLQLAYQAPVRNGMAPGEQPNAINYGSWQFIDPRSLNAKGSGEERFRMLCVIPGADQFPRLMEFCRAHHVTAIVESSKIDAWHTTEQGMADLMSLRQHTLRIVIFDGGHHLPTLALHPDLIIAPVTGGYIAHGYMRDALPLETLLRIARQEGLRSPIVTLPRWALVKTTGSMGKISVRALSKLPVETIQTEPIGYPLAPHFTVQGEAAYLYAEQDNYRTILEYGPRLPATVKRIYVAFNYNEVTGTQAKQLTARMRSWGRQVQVVNEPLNVPDIAVREVTQCITGTR